MRGCRRIRGSLMDNHIGDPGIQALAVSLPTCTRLTALAYAGRPPPVVRGPLQYGCIGLTLANRRMIARTAEQPGVQRS